MSMMNLTTTNLTYIMVSLESIPMEVGVVIAWPTSLANLVTDDIDSESGESGDSSQLDDTPSDRTLDDVSDAWDVNDHSNSNPESNSSSISRTSDPNLGTLVSTLNLKGDPNKNEKQSLDMTIPEIYTSMQLNVATEVPNENYAPIICQLCQQISSDKKRFYDHILAHTVSDFIMK